MRHAKAEPFAATDHARTLTERGRADAVEAGSYLASTSVLPDFALVSSAARATATWEAVASASGSTAEVRIDDAFFTGSADTVLDALHAVPERAERVIFVGHNPTASYLAHVLDDGEGEPDAILGLLQGFPTAALTVLEVPVPWRELGPESARVIDFHLGRG
jgi:phosphohistidine phosphatase